MPGKKQLKSTTMKSLQSPTVSVHTSQTIRTSGIAHKHEVISQQTPCTSGIAHKHEMNCLVPKPLKFQHCSNFTTVWFMKRRHAQKQIGSLKSKQIAEHATNCLKYFLTYHTKISNFLINAKLNVLKQIIF